MKFSFCLAHDIRGASFSRLILGMGVMLLCMASLRADGLGDVSQGANSKSVPDAVLSDKLKNGVSAESEVAKDVAENVGTKTGPASGVRDEGGKQGVASEQGIDDFSARLELARVLSWQKGKERDALEEYHHLLQQQPKNGVVLREAGRLHLRLGDPTGARRLFAEALACAPEAHMDIQLDLADVEVMLGHAAEARRLYHEALAEKPSLEGTFRIADGIQLWGAFYDAEHILRKALASNSEQDEIRFRLARVLEAMQRYDEAEAEYRILSHHPEQAQKANAEREALLRRKNKTHVDGALDADKPSPAQSRSVTYELPKAISAHSTGNDAGDIAAERMDAAMSAVQRYATVLQYAHRGEAKAALAACEALIKTHPAFFPAQLERALLLAEERRFDESVAALDVLLAAFPDSSRMRLERARILGWGKQYEASVAAYEALHRLNPADPVPVREWARVLCWDKRMDAAQVVYHTLLEPKVDAVLLSAMEAEDWPETSKAHLRAMLQQGAGAAWDGGGYEALAREVGAESSFADEDMRARVQFLLDQHWARYATQKIIRAEAQAKKLAWDHRSRRALAAYDELIRLEPGNEEARFDRAQLATGLGLHDVARGGYDELIAMDPRHRLAQDAVKDQARKQSPQVSVIHTYWDEKGRGELSDFSHHRVISALKLSLTPRQTLIATGVYWRERAGQDAGERADIAEAAGGGLAWRGVITPWLSVFADWTKKSYAGSTYGDMDLGGGGFALNAADLFHLHVEARTEEAVTNHFALEDGLRVDKLMARLSIPLTREWTLTASGNESWYADSNHSSQATFKAAWQLLEHPTELTAFALAEWRDTDEVNRDIVADGVRVQMLHPYWTPQAYTMGMAGLEWRHDLSPRFFRESEQRYYSVRIAGGNDSDNNAFVQGNLTAHAEWGERWSMEAGAFVHRSKEWDAVGSHLSLALTF